jgi:hypothetical protein
LCGVNACEHVTLATTMWSDVSEDIGTTREKQLTSIFWNEMRTRGMQIQRFLATYESAWDIVQSLVERMSITHIQIQRELVDIEKILPETDAGQVLRQELEQSLRKLKERAQALQDRRTPETMAGYAEAERNIRSALEGIKMLKIPLGRRIMGFLGLRKRDDDRWEDKTNAASSSSVSQLRG